MNQPLRKFKPAPGQWSLRNRLVIGVVVLGALGIAASDLAATTAFRTFLIAQVDAQLETASGSSVLRLERAGISSQREKDRESGPIFEPFEPIREAPTEITISLLDPAGNVLGTLGGAMQTERLQAAITGLSIDQIRERGGEPFTIRAGERGNYEYRVLARAVPGDLGGVVHGLRCRGGA